MMKNDRYSELLDKLNIILSGGGSVPPVSPTQGGFEHSQSVPNHFFLSAGMDIESLSKDQRLLAHAMLHKFNASGCKTLSKPEIKELHTKIVHGLTNHVKFDKLDE